MMDLDSITVETDLFEHREVKPHFILGSTEGIRVIRDEEAR